MRNDHLLHLICLTCLSTIACSESNQDTQHNTSITDMIASDLSLDSSINQDMEVDLAMTSAPGTDMRINTAEQFSLSPGLHRREIEHDGLMREYLLYIPQAYTPESSWPIMLMFHSNGSNMNRFLLTADFRALADSEGFIIVYPQGSILDGEGSHWNPILPSATNKSDADDLGFVSTLLDYLALNMTIDESRVYAAGYSNGADLAYGLACYLSDKITAIAPVSGSMYLEMGENCNPTHPTSVIIFNGTDDFFRPYNGYPGYLMSVEDAVLHWRQMNQLSMSPTIDQFNSNGLTIERSTYNAAEDSVSVSLFKVLNGQHVWFEFNIENIDMNQIIWNFLSQFNIEGRR